MPDKAEFWTTEQVADYLGITVQQVYESSRRGEFPGSIGKQRGRRKLYNADLVQAGPQEPKSTSDPLEALLWTAQGIEAKLAEILTELRKPVVVEETTTEYTVEIEGDDDE